MARLKKKQGESGHSAAFISRSRALSRLQLSLASFRRLCILKGIYPRDPPKKKRLLKVAPGKGGMDQTFYAIKDIQYLNADPLVMKLREEKSWEKRVARWRAKGELSKKRLASKPTYSLDHLVRERYPTFSDALKDLDDALSMIALFAVLPKIPSLSTGEASQIRDDYSQECSRLYQEFMAVIVATRSLESSFISIRGIYYRAIVCGIPITWITPHERCTELPGGVDFRVMLSFVEWWMVVLGFVNFRLFARLGWEYPLKNEEVLPLLRIRPEEGHQEETTISLNNLPPLKPDSEHAMQLQLTEKTSQIFEHLVFYVNRECPMKTLTFLILSHGGTVINLTSTLEYNNDYDIESDPTITHQIVDRPGLQRVFGDRVYVQPQWIWDSINQGKLLAKELYGVGIALPPHLSPFVQEEPEEDENGEEDNTEQKEDIQTETDKGTIKSKTGKSKPLTKEQRQLAVSMLSKKQKKVYRRVAIAQERKVKVKEALKSKRQQLETN